MTSAHPSYLGIESRFTFAGFDSKNLQPKNLALLVTETITEKGCFRKVNGFYSASSRQRGKKELYTKDVL